MLLRIMTVAAWIILAPVGARAVEVPDAADIAAAAQVALLPDWCEFYFKTSNLAPQNATDPAMSSKLAGFIRKGCAGHDRYCSALARANRVLMSQTFQSQPMSIEMQGSQFDAALADFDHVLRSSKPACPLVPDMYTKSGEWMTKVGKYKIALERFQKAIRARNDYAPAYIGLSDLYETLEKPDYALAALQQGIKANPQSTALKKKLNRLQQRVGQQPSQ